MCFTPTISISVAIIEFILATILLLYFPRTTLRNFSAGLIYLLGFYQFTEFMLCTSGNPLLWANLGFITYTFLPAIGLHNAFRFVKRKPNLFLIYLIPVVSSILTVYFHLITSASCSNFFIEVNNIINHTTSSSRYLLFLGYNAYYFGFILAMCLLFYLDFRKNKYGIRKEIDIVEIIGVLLMTVPVIIILVILPYLSRRIPSILCSFALFVTFASFIAVYLESKIKKKKINVERKK